MSETHYSTDHELRFLAKLGTYHEPLMPRRHLLHQYLASMQLRADWERIDRVAVAAYVTRMIREES